jgi:NADH dehydrogenase
MNGPSRPARVVVAGGGYAGASVAAGLGRAVRRGVVQVDIVSDPTALVRLPLLPALATGGPGTRATAIPLTRLVPHAKVHEGRVVGVDASSGVVKFVNSTSDRAGELAYDHLVVCLGGTADDRGVPGVREHATCLRTLGDAAHIRMRAEAALAAASGPRTKVSRAVRTVVIAGGGPAGVSLAGCLADMGAAAHARAALPTRLPLRVIVSDHKPRLLTALPEAVSNAAADALTGKGVELRLGDPLVEVTADTARFKSGTTLGCGLVVWTAGVRAPEVVELTFPGDKTTGGRLAVEPTLAVRRADGLWACGDAASVPNLEAGGDCPATAIYATAQGRRVAANILAVLADRYPHSFRLTSPTALACTGWSDARGSVGRAGRLIHGKAAWLLWWAGVTTPRAYARIGAGDASFPPDTLRHVPLPATRPSETRVTLGRKPVP